MSDTQKKILKAHQLTARSSGTLALGLGRNKIGRKAMTVVAQDLRAAADVIDEVLNG